MTEDEARKLGELAARLGSTPLRVLARAAALHDAPRTEHEVLGDLRKSGKSAPGTPDNNANLLLTPIADHAKGEVDDAFALLWPTSRKDEA